jgi:hypothetical protein
MRRSKTLYRGTRVAVDIGPLAAHVLPAELAQLVVEDGCKLLERLGIPPSPRGVMSPDVINATTRLSYVRKRLQSAPRARCRFRAPFPLERAGEGLSKVCES